MPRIIQTYLSDTFATQLEAKYGPLTGSVVGDILRGALLADIKPVPKPQVARKEKPPAGPMGRPKVTLEAVESRVLEFLKTTPLSHTDQLSTYCRYSKNRIKGALESLAQQGKVVVQQRLVDGRAVLYVALAARQGTNSTDPVGE